VPVTAAVSAGIHLKVIELHQPKRGFILSPRRWLVERSLALSACFHCVSRDRK
jgi:hypothetical protein